MKHKNHMSISEFSQLTGIKRANLIFYDKEGLLTPEYRSDNKYRCYTRRQLSSAYLIATLRELGIGLEEIKAYAHSRTPGRMISLFELQEERIRSEIRKLSYMREIMAIYKKMAREALTVEIDTIELREQKKEPIFLGAEIESGQTQDEGFLSFYNYAARQGIGSGFPLGTIIPSALLKEKKTEPAIRYYFKVNEDQNAYKPAGCYAVAYGICGYDQAVKVYERLFQYIGEHNLTICGDAYEEYLLTELSMQQEEDYHVRVEIMVSPSS